MRTSSTSAAVPHPFGWLLVAFALNAVGCTSAGDRECGDDSDCAAGERCVIGLCTPMPADTSGWNDATEGGDPTSPPRSSGDDPQRSSAPPSGDDATAGSRPSSSDPSDASSGTGGTPASGTDPPLGPPPTRAPGSDPSTPGATGTSGTPGGVSPGSTEEPDATDGGTSDGGASHAGTDGTGPETREPGSSGGAASRTSDIGSDPAGNTDDPGSAGASTGCDDMPTGAAACLLELASEDGSGTASDASPTVVCPALRPFCGEEVWTTPLGAIARCTDESVARNATYRASPEVAAVFRDERTCDGEDTNCDGRVDEQCCRVTGGTPEPLGLPGACLPAFEQGQLPGWPAPADRESLVQRVLLDLRVRGEVGEAIWYRLTPSGFQLVVDRFHPRSGSALSRSVVDLPAVIGLSASWLVWEDDLMVFSPMGEAGVLAHRIRFVGEGEPMVAALTVDAPQVEALAVAAFVLPQTGRSDEVLLIAVAREPEHEGLQVVRHRLQVLETVLQSVGGAQQLDLVDDGSPYLAGTLVEDTVLLAARWAGESDVPLAWCWQEYPDAGEMGTACFHVDAPLTGSAEATLWYRGEGALAASAQGPLARRPNRWGMLLVDPFEGNQTVLKLDGSVVPPSATAVDLDVHPDEGRAHWLDRPSGPVVWFADDQAEATRLADDPGALGSQLQGVVDEALAETSRTLPGALTPLAVLTHDDTEWVLATQNVEDGPCARFGSVEAWLVAFARSGERLCIEE